eukprot:scaffold118388_cov42-Phaeocystis_antarctica.AAC.1
MPVGSVVWRDGMGLAGIAQASEAEARRAAIEEARLEPARRDVELAARAAEEQVAASMAVVRPVTNAAAAARGEDTRRE